jgi:enoyl-[acyl-carrier protein] reductase II
VSNRVCELFQIDKPIIQAGMVWCSGWELASAVSNSGALGIIGSGSMYPDILQDQIRKYKKASDKPFAVNVPLMYPSIQDHMRIIMEEKVPIVFSSAGNPRTWTSTLQAEGIKVAHVVPSAKFAAKAEAAGVDAVVCEGFEAGGHNGREETTSMVLIPMVRDAIQIPLIAAGGIGSGRAMLAAMALGAEAVQIGSRFVASEESSAHQNFKDRVCDAGEGETLLSMKKLVPVRLLSNTFQQRIFDAEAAGADANELGKLLGVGRAKKGMFEGDLDEGELEIGQISGAISEIKPAADIVEEIWQEYLEAKRKLTAE